MKLQLGQQVAGGDANKRAGREAQHLSQSFVRRTDGLRGHEEQYHSQRRDERSRAR